MRMGNEWRRWIAGPGLLPIVVAVGLVISGCQTLDASDPVSPPANRVAADDCADRESGSALPVALLAQAEPPVRANRAGRAADDGGGRDNRLTILDGVIVPRGMTMVELGGVARIDANVRMGPGVEHPVVRRVAQGELLFATARAANGWYLLETEGRAYGYISGKLFVALQRQRRSQ